MRPADRAGRAARSLQTVVVTWEPGTHWCYRFCEICLYTLAKRKGWGKVRAGYSQEGKIQGKLDRTIIISIHFNSVDIHSNMCSLRASCMPSTVLNTEKYKDEHSTVLEVFTVLLGKVDTSAAKC